MKNPASAGLDAAAPAGADHDVPLAAYLGIRRERAQDGEAMLSLELQPHLSNNHGAGQGGVVMTLLELAMGDAALSRNQSAREVSTVDLHVVFMRAAAGRLVATARVTGGGRSLCFCEARVEDCAGKLAAQALGTLRYRNAG